MTASAATSTTCTIRGTAKAEVLVGTSRRDVICGLGGADVLRGRGGDDLLKGGAGPDRLVGGAGACFSPEEEPTGVYGGDGTGKASPITRLDNLAGHHS